MAKPLGLGRSERGSGEIERDALFTDHPLGRFEVAPDTSPDLPPDLRLPVRRHVQKMVEENGADRAPVFTVRKRSAIYGHCPVGPPGERSEGEPLLPNEDPVRARRDAERNGAYPFD